MRGAELMAQRKEGVDIVGGTVLKLPGDVVGAVILFGFDQEPDQELVHLAVGGVGVVQLRQDLFQLEGGDFIEIAVSHSEKDRKLNSSHVASSYVVFCFKK